MTLDSVGECHCNLYVVYIPSAMSTALQLHHTRGKSVIKKTQQCTILHSFVPFDMWYACIAQIKFKWVKLKFSLFLELDGPDGSDGQSSKEINYYYPFNVAWACTIKKIKLYTAFWLISSEFNGLSTMFRPTIHLWHSHSIFQFEFPKF